MTKGLGAYERATIEKVAEVFAAFKDHEHLKKGPQGEARPTSAEIAANAATLTLAFFHAIEGPAEV